MMANSETDTTISSERVIRDRHKLVICAEVVKQVVQSKRDSLCCPDVFHQRRVFTETLAKGKETD